MLWTLIAVICIVIDRLTKIYISAKLDLGESIPIFKNVFHITYHLNDGAAFSILQGRRVFLIITTVLILSSIILYVIIKKPKNKLVLLSLSMVVGGALGNLIDRIKYGSVIDFLDFRLINFPVFNMADTFVVLGAICLFIASIKYGEEL